MKKILSILLSLSLLLSVLPAGAESSAVKLEMKAVPIYANSATPTGIPFPLWFSSDAPDIPFVEVEDWTALLADYQNSMPGRTGYALAVSKDDGTVVIRRETGATVLLDYEYGQVNFPDFNVFNLPPASSDLLDTVRAGGFNEKGEAQLFFRVPSDSYTRMGLPLSLDLKSYEIPVYRDGDSCFLPLQTVSDFFFSVSCNTNITYNGQAIFLATADAFVQNQELTDLGVVYYDAPKRERSKALCDFGYNELCLALDTLYGLKQEHMIHSFDELFWQIGLKDQLKDPDPTAADDALDFFIQYYLDDLHSEFRSTSPLAEPKAVENVYGRANEKLYHDFPIYSNLRSAAFPDGVPDYQEVGNTAYITFDQFFFAEAGDDYYTAESDEELPNDTVSLIIRAHRYITRENSPIENVVLDLTNNTGGSVDAAVFILGWLMGDAPLSIHYSATDAMATTLTRADVNLDRKFDKDDVISNQKIFVLTSPVSFSCGNLLPCVLGSTDRAALVGRATAGGACMVQPLSTAWGSIFTISGPYRLSFLKNGSFYNADQGIEPDYYVENLANLYNREALTKYLNDLF